MTTTCELPPSEGCVTFDLSDEMTLDRAVYHNGKFNDEGHLNVVARLVPPPVVGDTLKLSNRTIWRFTAVRQFDSSPDLFDAYVEQVQ